MNRQDNIIIKIIKILKKFLKIIYESVVSKNIIKYDITWDKVFFVSSYSKAMIFILRSNVNNIIAHTDISILLAIVAKIKSVEVYIYEEGCGSYMNKRVKRPFISSVIAKFIGVGNKLTSSRYIEAAYLYFPQLFYNLRPHEKVRIIKIKENFPLHFI